MENLTCFYCEADISKGNKEYATLNLHIDHYWPKSKDGSDDNYNLVPSCSYCNHDKGAMLPSEWASRCLLDFWIALDRLHWLIPKSVIETIRLLIELHSFIYQNWSIPNHPNWSPEELPFIKSKIITYSNHATNGRQK